MEVDLQRASALADEYRRTSLYEALDARLRELVDEANRVPAADPHAVMRLRGQVEAFSRILAPGFLVELAMRALVVQAQRHAAAADASPIPSNDRSWWADAADLVN